MQPNRSQLQKVVEIIQNGTSGLICIPENPSPDAVAAATALYMGLMQLGKSTAIACSSPVQSNLIAADKIQSEMATSGDNLVISFPYQDGSIDKVDYFIQNDLFNIVVSPRAGTPKIEQKDVKFNYTGGTVDFIVTIDTTNLRQLGQLYADNQEQFKGKKIVNIDRHLTNSFYGTANYVNRTVSSTAELILGILQTMNVQIEPDIAANLYAGVLAATNNYTAQTVNAQTFEVSAFLMKQGAGKQAPQAQTRTQAPAPAQNMSISNGVGRPVRRAPQQQPARALPPMDDDYMDDFDEPVMPRAPQPRQPQAVQPVQRPVQQQPMPQPTQPRSFNRPKSARPVNALERDQVANMAEGNDADDTDEDNEEWLKPKIFKPQGPGTSETG